MASRRQSPLRRRLGTGLLVACIALLLVYPMDWLVWKVLCATGHGMGSAVVTQTTAATLKGNHFEVYSQQTTSVSCSRSLLPEAGAGACWWVRRHPQVVTQY